MDEERVVYAGETRVWVVTVSAGVAQGMLKEIKKNNGIWFHILFAVASNDRI